MPNLPLDLLAHVAWLGPLSIFGAWLLLGRDPKLRGRFLAIAGGLLLAQAAAGVVTGYLDPKTTMLGDSLLFSSTSWILAPALAACFGAGRVVVGVPLGLVTPFMGGFLGFVCAVMTGAINPCG